MKYVNNEKVFENFTEIEFDSINRMFLPPKKDKNWIGKLVGENGSDYINYDSLGRIVFIRPKILTDKEMNQLNNLYERTINQFNKMKHLDKPELEWYSFGGNVFFIDIDKTFTPFIYKNYKILKYSETCYRLSYHNIVFYKENFSTLESCLEYIDSNLSKIKYFYSFLNNNIVYQYEETEV